MLPLLLALVTFVNTSAAKDILFTKKEKILNRFQPAKEVLDAIGVKPGMVVGEIGAGQGQRANPSGFRALAQNGGDTEC